MLAFSLCQEGSLYMCFHPFSPRMHIGMGNILSSWMRKLQLKKNQDLISNLFSIVLHSILWLKFSFYL